MPADKKNVIVGAARVWIAAFNAVKPAAVAATSYNTTLAGTSSATPASDRWSDVGYTQEGVELSYEPDFGDVEVDQLLDSARVHKSSQRVTVATTFAEATLKNLIVVLGQRDTSLTTTGTGDTQVDELVLQGGSLGESPVERQFVAVGNGAENATTGFYNERTYHAYRAISTETSAHSVRRNEATVFPVTFRLLPTDAANAPYGTIRDRVRTATWA